MENDTVWLTANQMAALFDRDEKTIRKHVNNVFAEGELAKENNTHFLRVVGVKSPAGKGHDGKSRGKPHQQGQLIRRETKPETAIDRDECIKWICDFASSQGGKILVGANDRGHVVGLSSAKKWMGERYPFPKNAMREAVYNASKQRQSIPGKQIGAQAKVLRCRFRRYIVKFQQMIDFGSLDAEVYVL